MSGSFLTLLLSKLAFQNGEAPHKRHARLDAVAILMQSSSCDRSKFGNGTKLPQDVAVKRDRPQDVGGYWRVQTTFPDFETVTSSSPYDTQCRFGKLKERNPNRGKVCPSRNIQGPSLATRDLNALEQ